MNMSFVPSEENAEKLETWNKSHGHHHSSCRRSSQFNMSTCAVNCYSQWFSGLCPDKSFPQNRGFLEVPMTQQYSVAKTKLLRYNLIVITEMLQNPKYVDAVERFFGVTGLIPRRDVHPWCEVESHYSNEIVPLVIRNETLNSLTQLNEIDVSLYHEIRDCLDVDTNFPAWNENRFEGNETIQVDHIIWERQNPIRGYSVPQKKWLKKFNSSNDHYSAFSSPAAAEISTPSNPACEPHFRVAQRNGGWAEAPKFKRLYFYHSRKAGVSSSCIYDFIE